VWWQDCWIKLWTKVSAVFRPKGKQIAMSVDDSAPHKESRSDKAWSYITNWDMFVNFTDVLIGESMASYGHSISPVLRELFAAMICWFTSCWLQSPCKLLV
jgi:hypothetical protein